LLPAADDGIVVAGRAAAMGEAPRLTTDEYLAGEETLLPQELIWGVVRDAPTPHPRHQRAVFRLGRLMHEHVEAHGLGEVFMSPLDVILDEARALVVQPDIFFVAKDRLGLVSDHVRGAPDLVVEVLSPRPRIGRLDERLRWFATYGVGECWVVHQLSAYVDVLHFGGGHITTRRRFGANEPIRSLVLAGFAHAFADFVSPDW
jgi:Uma2 family endonuclease